MGNLRKPHNCRRSETECHIKFRMAHPYKVKINQTISQPSYMPAWNYSVHELRFAILYVITTLAWHHVRLEIHCVYRKPYFSVQPAYLQFYLTAGLIQQLRTINLSHAGRSGSCDTNIMLLYFWATDLVEKSYCGWSDVINDRWLQITRHVTTSEQRRAVKRRLVDEIESHNYQI